MNTRNFGSLFYTINFNYARRMAFIRQTIRYECEIRWRVENERKIKIEMSNRTKKKDYAFRIQISIDNSNREHFINTLIIKLSVRSLRQRIS